MDKIIYVLPYTSIIEQNAKTVRDILDNNNINNIVLESHSNLAADLRTDEYEQVSVNWNAPVVFTTIVQFMETIFSDKIRQNRRLHAMTNSILIFDEVQCIPTNCLYMFNDFLRFITSVGRSTAILCTATQPLLDKIPVDKHGADHSIVFDPETQIDIDETELFAQLKRVNVIDKRIPGGWDDQKIVDFICANDSKSILIIVNTKKNAWTLYSHLRGYEKNDAELVYLSTNMCPAHRKKAIADIKNTLDNKNCDKRLICISTQLIEAGVDIDSNCVIRYVAGLDSIAQAAGRCNRNGRMPEKGSLYIINHKYENLSNLKDIRRGQSASISVLEEYKINPGKFNNDLLGEYAINRYFSLIYNELGNLNKEHFEYIPADCDDTLYDLLSVNAKHAKRYVWENPGGFNPSFLQAFQTAGNLFKCIDTETKGVIVPYGKGKELIAELASAENQFYISELLKYAQPYSINIFPYMFDRLYDNGIYKVQQDMDIYYLAGSMYDEVIGFSENGNSLLDY